MSPTNLPTIREFHHLLPLKNLRSVLQYGILSPEKAEHYTHTTTTTASAAAEQQKRAKLTVPNGLKLSQYATLYFHARNPVLYRQREEADTLCVLAVSKQVLHIEGTVITDQDEASDFVRFFPPAALDQLDLAPILDRNWLPSSENDYDKDHNRVAAWRQAAHKRAGVLVPHLVPADYIRGAYVVSESVQAMLAKHLDTFKVKVDPALFFR